MLGARRPANARSAVERLDLPSGPLRSCRLIISPVTIRAASARRPRRSPAHLHPLDSPASIGPGPRGDSSENPPSEHSSAAAAVGNGAAAVELHVEPIVAECSQRRRPSPPAGTAAIHGCATVPAVGAACPRLSARTAAAAGRFHPARANSAPPSSPPSTSSRDWWEDDVRSS